MSLGGANMGAWKQKQVTVANAISLGGTFASLIASNVPNGTEFVIIANDNLDKTQYINNQLVYGVYAPNDAKANVFCRYRSNDYSCQVESLQLWTDTYALTASQGDMYTLFYQ